MTASTERLQQIAAMYAKHADELHNLVRRRASGAQSATIDDACSFAWTQLISAGVGTRRELADCCLEAKGAVGCRVQ